MPNINSRCNLCHHPARLEIDSMLMSPGISLKEVREWCLDNYPDDIVPNVTGFSRHRTEHLQAELSLTPGNLSIRDGQVIDGSGRPLEQIGVAAALKAILTIGVRNIMLYPERVTVKDTIDVLKIMKSLGETEGDLEEFFNMWASTVVSTSTKKRRKKAPVEAEVTEITTEEEENTDDNPWEEVSGS